MKINLSTFFIFSLLVTSCITRVKAQAPQQINNVGSIQWYGLPNCNWIITSNSILTPCISGGGGGVTLQTNSVSNSSQTVLNLLSGTVIQGFASTATNTGGGNVQLNIGFTNEGVGAFFAGPVSGPIASPTWRLMNILDLPPTLLILTTTGSTGAATYTPGNPGTLNIPNYVGTGGGTVTSVQMTMPTTLFTGCNITITTSGNFNCAYATGQTANLVLGTDGSGAVGFHAPFTLTTIGTGAATFTGGTLNIPTASGSLPTFVANQYLTNNGTTANWGEILVGPTGGLCSGIGCVSGTPGIVDVDPTVIPFLGANPQTFTSATTFNQKLTQKLTVSTLPTCNAGRETQEGWVTDATAPIYNGALTGGGTVHVPVFCDGTIWRSH